MTDVCSQLLGLVPDELRRRVEARVRPMKAAKGRTVLGVGAMPDDVLFILEGEASVALHSVNGREISVRRLGPGDIFGDLAALDGRPRNANVVAQTDLRLSAMNQSDFLDCLSSSSEASIWFTRRLVGEVRRLTEKVFELSALNVQARLLCELLRLARTAPPTSGPGVTLSDAPTHSELANRIATQREAVTREIRSLAAQGILKHNRRSMHFPSLELLEHEVSRVVGVISEPVTSRPRPSAIR